MKIAILGATGKTGRYVVARLCERGHEVTAVGRRTDRLAALDPRARRAGADLDHPESVAPALRGAESVVSLAHARFVETILAALPGTCEHLVLTGSTRKFTSLPDPAADAVRRGEAAFLASGRPGVMLHPSMIYGAPDDRNVNRILGYLARWPRRLPAIAPLPDGGRHLVQPLFVDDAADAFAAAAERREAAGPPLVLAGPESMTYAEMVGRCAAALGRRVVTLPVPVGPMAALAGAAAAIGLRLPLAAGEIRRAADDKSFDVGEMIHRLGVTPRPFADGLRAKLERGWTNFRHNQATWPPT